MTAAPPEGLRRASVPTYRIGKERTTLSVWGVTASRVLMLAYPDFSVSAHRVNLCKIQQLPMQLLTFFRVQKVILPPRRPLTILFGSCEAIPTNRHEYL
jgi:hypothetical protein